METPLRNYVTVGMKLPIGDWQAVASMVIMARSTGEKASISSWIVEAVRQRLVKEYPNPALPDTNTT
jgi:hypothetical protein